LGQLPMKKNYIVILFIVFISCRDHSPISFTEKASFGNLFSFFRAEKIKIDTILLNSYHDTLLKNLYQKNNFEVLWEQKEHRNLAIAELQKSYEEGLDITDYYVNYLSKQEAKYDSLNQNQKVTYDIELTRSFQKYIRHINQGKINPYELYDDWDFGKKSTDVNTVLMECLTTSNFSEEIEKLKPQIKLYQQLKESLKKLNEYPDKNIEQVNPKEKFSLKSASKSIILIKKKLIYWGDLKKKDSALTKTYDKETQTAIKHFQKRHGLRADGVIGKGTIEALNYSRNQRIEQVVVNMERLRWLPSHLGNHYLLVNLPNYYLTVYKDNDSILSHKVVVGKDSRKTPLLSAKLNNIILNPNWTVPPTILKEDVFPEAVRSKSAFSKRGLHIFDSKNREVSPWKWKMEDAKRYKYVQNPSKNNSLGFIKINFSNKYAVYLHDTNHRNYFKYDYRALSSGCVRVENPLELGSYLLQDNENWSLEKIEEVTKNAKKLKTTSIDLEEDIYVHFLYNTVWMENNTLQFREDMYCLDADLYSKLRY
jgi:L,D-transpeptidase YcbB